MIDAAEREKLARELAEKIRRLIRTYEAGVGAYIHIEDEMAIIFAKALALCANEALERAAQVAEQYHKQLSLNGATAEIWSVASDIRDDIRALKAEG